VLVRRDRRYLPFAWAFLFATLAIAAVPSIAWGQVAVAEVEATSATSAEPLPSGDVVPPPPESAPAQVGEFGASPAPAAVESTDPAPAEGSASAPPADTAPAPVEPVPDNGAVSPEPAIPADPLSPVAADPAPAPSVEPPAAPAPPEPGVAVTPAVPVTGVPVGPIPDASPALPDGLGAVVAPAPAEVAAPLVAPEAAVVPDPDPQSVAAAVAPEELIQAPPEAELGADPAPVGVLGKIATSGVPAGVAPQPEPVVRVTTAPAEVVPILDALPVEVSLDSPGTASGTDRSVDAPPGQALLLKSHQEQANPPNVQLELPVGGSSAPSPGSAGASASASSSPGGSVGVGFVALAALLTLLICVRSARIRLASAAWRPTYLLSLPERPG
jgi:hypothetical protein